MVRTASSLTRRAGRLDVASGLFDALEPRVLLSSFVYQEIETLFVSDAPLTVIRPTGDDATATIASDVAALGDIDGDGAPDFIVGAGGDEETDIDGSGQGGAEAVVYSGLTGEELFRFEDGFSEFGAAVAGLGDVNDDGVVDFAVGSPRFGATTPNEIDGPGRAYVYSGANGVLLFTLDGEMPADRFGAAIADAGDIDGDGVSDIAVGAPGADGERGSVFLYSGGDASLIRRVDGQTVNSRFGFDIAALGDMDADGFGEIVVGAPGRAEAQVAIPGQAFIVAGVDGAITTTFTGAHDGDLFGYTVANAGDVDGDSIMDIAVGAPFHNVELTDGNIVARAGAVRIFSGADGTLIHTINGDTSNAHLGAALTPAGDLNLDNTPDLLIGAPGAGSVLLVSGATALPLTTFAADTHELAGADRIGTSIATLGDLNGDNVPDFLFAGTQSADLEGDDDRNRFYVFSGAAALDLTPEGINNDNDIWGTAQTGAFLILDNEFFLLEGQPGLAGSDRIIDVNTSGVVLGVSSGGQSFIWSDGVRTPVMDLITSTEGPTDVFTTLRAVDIAEDGDILIERRRADGLMTAWVLDGGVLRFRFEGIPIAMNNDGWVVGLDNDPVSTTSILWTPDGITTIPSFIAADISEAGDLAGTGVATGGGTFAAVRTTDGTIINLGTLPNATEFRVTAISDDRHVIGSYVGAGGQDGGWVWDSEAGMQDIKAATVTGATEQFATSTDFALLDITDTGVIIGSLNDFDTGFTLTPFDDAGPFTGQDAVSLSRDSAGDLQVATRNQAGEVVVFRMPAGADTWVADDLRTDAGVPGALTESVSFADPRTGENFVAVGTADGVLILVRTEDDGNEVWQSRNLTQELAAAGAENITTNLLTFTNVDGTVYLAGQAADGDVVVYHQTGRLQNGQAEWTFVNLYEDQLAPTGQDLPAFASDLHGYVTPWGGLNIAGLDADGEIIVIWTSPELNGEWQTTNLTEVTGAPTLSGGLTTFVTPWGGINLVGLNAEGDVTSTWWVPGFGGTWLTNNLTQEFNGAKLRADSVTSYVTEWGGLNIAGIDEAGDVVIYWWVPGFNAWRITPVVTDFNDAPGRPVGELEGEATGDRIHLTGTAPDGDVIRIHWQPDVWRVENLTDQAINNAQA